MEIYKIKTELIEQMKKIEKQNEKILLRIEKNK